MIEGMAELPQFYQSNTTTNTGNFFTTPGAGSLNLRGLQGKRTLTLLSGRRVVPSTIYGGPDINIFPEKMMRSIETVTSGATATYGTDAVAGVVNFILDTNFEGVAGDVQTGQNERGDNNHYEASLRAGFALGENDRTHLLLAGERFEQDPIWSREGYDWYEGWGLLQNPDTANRGRTPDNPVNLPYKHVVSRQASLDGIITFPAASGLGVWSVDPNGNATPFVLGSAFDATAHSIANGGSGTENGEPEAQLQPETSSENFFTYLEHEFSDNFTVYGQAMYGEAAFTNKNLGGSLYGGRGITIYSGNPFIPANIQQMMIGTGTAAAPQFPTVTLGRVGDRSDIAFDAFTEQVTETLSVTVGFDLGIESDGFFNNWAVNGYYQNGTTDVDALQHGGIRIDRLYMATDARVGPNGNPICNVTLVSGQYPDCVPLNMFGRGRASAAAVDWVTGFTPGVPVSVNGWLPGGASVPYSYTSSDYKGRIIELEQDVFELSANGDIADGWGAGAIAMAFGVAYRDEGFVQYVQAPEGNPTASPTVLPVPASDAGCTTAIPPRVPPAGIRGVPCPDATNSVEIQFSKVPFGIGDFQVKEAFTELRLPLVADKGFAQRMDLNLAYRWADYSGSGQVGSWKGGLDWAITDNWRFRSTVSQDVRAATLGERYDRTGGLANVIDYGEDPLGGPNSRYDVTIVTGGNPNVEPEEAHTTTAGFVFLPGDENLWKISVDWYDIKIKDNINLFGTQNVVTNCHQLGDVDACTQIERNGPASTINPGLNRISIVNDIYVNVNEVGADGVDFEVQYNRPVNWFGGSNIGVRFLGSYLHENSRTNSAGVKTVTSGSFGLPERQFQLSGNFFHGPLTMSLQARYNEETLQDITRNIYQPSLGYIRYDVLDNTVDASTLIDANFAYNFDMRGGTNLRLYMTVNNLTDADPQEFFGFLGALNAGVGNGFVGDLRGRRYALGLSFDF
jgi:outer membrane receptor protein involved in Fe transport